VSREPLLSYNHAKIVPKINIPKPNIVMHDFQRI
jgi:hypothetical protein